MSSRFLRTPKAPLPKRRPPLARSTADSSRKTARKGNPANRPIKSAPADPSRALVLPFGFSSGFQPLEMKSEIARLRAGLTRLQREALLTGSPDPGVLSVRRLVRPTHFHSVGRVFSPRFGTIEYESGVSRDAIFIAHTDPLITLMVSQPLKLSWPNAADAIHPYFPDYAVMRAGKIVIIDALHDQEPETPVQERRCQERIEAFRRHGVSYEVWRASELQREPRLSNTRTLLASAHHQLSPEEIKAARLFVEQNPRCVPARAIVKALGYASEGVHRVFAMVFRGHLQLADPRQKINMDVLLKVCAE